MREDEFDEWVRSRLNGASSPVPDDMWQRITGKKKRRFAIFFPFWGYPATILPLLCMALGYFLYNKKEAPTKKIAIVNQPSGKVKNTSVHKSNPVAPAAPTAEDNDATKDKKPGNYNNNNTNNGKSNQRDFALTQTNSNVLNKIIAGNRVGSTKSRDYEYASKSNAPQLKENGTAKNAAAKTGENKATNTPALFEHEKNIPTREDPTHHQTTGIANNPFSNTTEQQVKVQKKIPKTIQSFIEPYFMAGLTSNYINPAGATYLSQVASTLTARLSYAGGVNWGLPLNNTFLFKTGIGLSLINEKLQFAQPVPGKQVWHIANGNIDVPVLLGYTVHGRKVAVSFNTGLIVSAVSWYKNYSFDSAVIASGTATKIYRAFTAVSAYAQIDLSIHVDKANQFFVGAFYRRYLNGVAIPPDPFSQKINIAGLSAGIRHELLKPRHRK